MSLSWRRYTGVLALIFRIHWVSRLDPSNSTIGTGSQPNVIENEKDKKRLYKCQEPGCESSRKFSLKDLKRHRNARHAENPDMFTCELEECKFDSKRKDHPTRHYKSDKHK
ncbi:hypothetical protein BofuT4_P126610.1 [Botrytis cinerea T4]|uniref:C2H2-type domain-containing protein n=1 Tax=Botryotinia fuckeliana (strain T4) TaxID=999810 RepID=G2YSL5_BOTF4|nr:hypothetical protein BofuT4_P126610.1 [Botrytis cinerea T4]